MESAQSVRDKLARFHRVALSDLPTRLEKLENLSQQFAPCSIYVKRDDQTGLAFGGNKSRKLDFIMADVLQQGADCIVTWAGVQSNWCRSVTAAATKLGIRTVLVLFKGPTTPEGDDGNLLLDRLFDAEIQVHDAAGIGNMLELESVRHLLEPVVEDQRRKGRKPYLAPIGGSMAEGSMSEPWGALGYVEAFLEIVEQAADVGARIDSIVLASGTGGTQAGLLAGAKLVSPHIRVVGVSVYATGGQVAEYILPVANGALEHLGSSARVEGEEVLVLDDYIGEGYGVFNAAVGEAIRRLARSEGLLLDPVYTGKSMTALIDLMNKGYFTEGENVLFLHTGGTPALFPYRSQILDHLAET
jgi:D-cysteine desulfhydrase family pyridoxal phosphate-dependent enzyme